MILRGFIPTLILFSGAVVYAQPFDELKKEWSAAPGPAERHRLAAQLAQAGIQQLETEELSKTAQKKMRAEVQALCSDVQLGAMDLWYGDSVVTWARLMLLDGRWKEARGTLLDQAEVLQNIERNLRANNLPVSAISPVAGCRYVLGETYRLDYEETQSLKPAVEALKHFYNVFIKYGDSPWGPLSEAKAEAARAFVEAQGKQVRIDLGSHRKAFVAGKFRLGARLTAQQNYAEAIDPILTALNVFPESGMSIDALRNLGICQFHLGQDGQAQMTAEYLCERFSSDTNAPAAVLSIGRQFLDQNNGIAAQIFESYLAEFPSDPHRTDILSWFAWRAYKAEAWEDAAARFQTLETALRETGQSGEPLEKAVYIQADCSKRIDDYDRFLTEFPASELAPRALGEKAQAQLVAGNFDAAFQTLELLSERYPESNAARTALAGLIVAAVEKQRFDIAGQVLDRMLADKQSYGNSVYLSTGNALLKAEKFELAEKAFTAVQPASEQSLYGTAAAQFGQEQFEASFQTLENLLAAFPSSGMFFEARLMQARALVRLGRNADAVAAYSDVITARPDYSVSFEMAQILTDPEERLAAFQRIALLADPDTRVNRPLIAESIIASLPLCLELHKYDLAVQSCNQFEELFPQHEQLPVLGKFRKEAEDAMAQ